MKDLKQLEQKYEALGKEIEALKTEKIKVPKCIKIERWVCQDTPLGIVNDNQRLFSCNGIWQVSQSKPSFYMANAYLVPIARTDLNAGDVAFRADHEHLSQEELEHYCIILNDREYIRWCPVASTPLVIASAEWKLWYKVVNG